MEKETKKIDKERYVANKEAFSQEELDVILQKRISVLGCGGLGGYVCQGFARFGVGGLTVVDGDVFSVSNLNRQLFATEENLGRPKAYVCKEELAKINSDLCVTARVEMMTPQNVCAILADADIAIDCLDNIEGRFVLAEACTALNLPMVHGAIGGFFGQVANLFPGDGLLARIYPDRLKKDTGIEKAMGNPAFMPQIIAAIQVSEALKILTGKGEILQNSLLYVDLLGCSFEKICLQAGQE